MATLSIHYSNLLSMRFYLLPLLFSIAFVACQQTPPPAPEGMVYFQGGEATIGAKDGLPNEQPVFDTKVKDFYLDSHPVTVGQFRDFVEATGYRTEAETFGDAGVFNVARLQKLVQDAGYEVATMEKLSYQGMYDLQARGWELVKGAYWEYPMGPEYPKAEDSHPVTQVSWNDANAYAAWAGKRLPTEVEWEYAARNGKNAARPYSWGNELAPNGVFKANVWEGNFPINNNEADQYALTSPVGAFGITECGLSDMGGNVWEWCSDTYRPYEGNNDPFQLAEVNKVIRGGSFLCDESFCHGYRVSARTFCSAETALFHQGFRCAKDVG